MNDLDFAIDTLKFERAKVSCALRELDRCQAAVMSSQGDKQRTEFQAQVNTLDAAIQALESASVCTNTRTTSPHFCARSATGQSAEHWPIPNEKILGYRFGTLIYSALGASYAKANNGYAANAEIIGHLLYNVSNDDLRNKITAFLATHVDER